MRPLAERPLSERRRIYSFITVRGFEEKDTSDKKGDMLELGRVEPGRTSPVPSRKNGLGEALWWGGREVKR